MSLGFRKNDYRALVSDIEENSDLPAATDGFLLSEVIETQDIVWDTWNHLLSKVDELSVPIFDEGSYTKFLNFLTRDNPYME